MFFTLSKLLWFVLRPGNVFVFALCAACLLFILDAHQKARLVLYCSSVLAVVLFILPTGNAMTAMLEKRHPIIKSWPEKDITGMIVLGGFVSQEISYKTGQGAMNGAGERFFSMIAYAKDDASADKPIIFTGGSGLLFGQDMKEAGVVRRLVEEAGFETSRFWWEDKSRNTYENAILTKKMLEEEHGQDLKTSRWILVTSAMHMPRAAAVFEAQGFNIVPFPVDFKSSVYASDVSTLSFNHNMSLVEQSLREWIGLVAYRLAGYTHKVL